MTEGRCACGAVTVRATGISRQMSACWCQPCRRFQGLVGMGLDTPADQCTITGPVRVWRSSDFAERGFCGTCGSSIWFRDIAGDIIELCPGLFHNAAGATLHHENFVERRPDAIRFDPQPQQISGAAYAAGALVIEGSAPPRDRMAGGCACGAVRFRLVGAPGACGMCHCDTCRRWTGGVNCYTGARLEDLTIEGEPELIRWASSPGARRVSCANCGGKLWYEVVTGDETGGTAGDVEIALGTLDDMGGRPLLSESYVDQRPAGYAFAGDHRRRTRAEVLAESATGGQP
ncbi:hypothetical protein DRW48_05745 [Paracoccus suum]|uniref:CENP-V/GFA domain-containing protein n=1 Tax=Paracoccus suum TaxID=2259340 RepID=A0A344PIP6_9RHOB|nr:GFA family protein [Paracoccus suum]AXC49251.1 hypothetical protein DRW48_05745 [Paracoccus suum]